MIGHSDNQAQPVKVKRAGKARGLAKQRQELAEAGRDRTFTRVELRVLRTVLNPELRVSRHEDRIKAAGVSKTQYYKVLNDPWMDDHRRNLLRGRLAAESESFINAAAQTARIVGREGDNARRLCLSITGDYVDRKQIDQNVTGQLTIGIVGVNLDDV